MLDDDVTPGREVLDALPVFPLPNVVLLPGMILPLNVFEPRYVALVEHVLGGGRHIGVPLLRPGFEADYGGRPDLEAVFGIGKLVSHRALPDGRHFIRLEGTGRVRCRRELEARQDFRELCVDVLPDSPPQDSHQLEVLKAQLERICTTLDVDDTRMVASVLDIPEACAMLYAIAAIMPTLGYSVMAHGRGEGRPASLELQQRCLDAQSPDALVSCLIGGAAAICDELGDSGCWPQRACN